MKSNIIQMYKKQKMENKLPSENINQILNTITI